MDSISPLKGILIVYVQPIFELGLIGVAEPNVPNRERILIRPTQSVPLTDFAVLVAFRNENGTLTPLWDHLFWFGTIQVAPPSWISLYTGRGTQSQVVEPVSGETIHNFYWNRDRTIFATTRVVPVVVRIGGLLSGVLLQEPAKPMR